MSWVRDADGADVGLTVGVASADGHEDAIGLTAGTVRIRMTAATARLVGTTLLAAAEMLETDTVPRHLQVDSNDAEAIARSVERYQRGDA